MPRSLIHSIAAALMLVEFFQASPAAASSAVVPDDYPTVQQAVDSGVDSVLIRPGTYAERPRIERAVVLRGTDPSQHPQLDGLDVTNLDFFADPPLLAVSHCDFSGPVALTTVNVHPRNLQIHFAECALDSGIWQLAQDPNDIATLTLYRCRLGGRSRAGPYAVVMDSSTVDGGIQFFSDESYIRNCSFRGGAGVDTGLIMTTIRGTVANSRFSNYRMGLLLQFLDGYDVINNLVDACTTGIQLKLISSAHVEGNSIERCGTGLFVINGSRVDLTGNRVTQCTGYGIRVGSVGIDIDGNVVMDNGGGGIAVEYQDDMTTIQRNTCHGNGGSGIAVIKPNVTVFPILVNNNILANNAVWGLAVDGSGIETSCNDWFENGSGSVTGIVPDASDMSVDPMFCDAPGGDLRLKPKSPLADVAACGQIGALQVGCSETATLLDLFQVDPVHGGVAVRWRFGSDEPASTWLERATGEPNVWTRVSGPQSRHEDEYAFLDRSVVVGQRYWYRVGWMMGGETWNSAPTEFTLGPAPLVSRVLPNPSVGLTQIEWTLDRAGVVEIAIFDLAGREVAKPTSGRFESGAHTIQWDGRTPDGQRVPMGWYVARLRSNEFVTAHTFLLLR